MQLFTGTNGTFIFCDFNWQRIDQDPGQSAVENTPDIYFQNYNGIYIWECGSFTGKSILSTYLLYRETFTDYIKLGTSSFILYDSESNIIIAARDFMGNYPLYYYENPTVKGSFIFTFSMNALVASQLFDLTINYAKVIEYIEVSLQSPPNNYTFYNHVYRLLPAYNIYIRQGKIKKLNRYGKFDLLKYSSFTDNEYIDRFQELFIKSVKKSTDSYKYVAASLSGGLDSSAICSVAQLLKSDPICTFNFKPYVPAAQEDEYVEVVVGKWKNNHKTIRSTYSGYAAIKKLTELNAQPFFVLNYTIQLDLIEAAKAQKCNVFLSGHWGDQVVDYGTQYIDELMIKKDWKSLKKAISQHIEISSHTSTNKELPTTDTYKKTINLYAIKLLWRTIKSKNQWADLPTALWVLVKYFNCNLPDFFVVFWQRINQKKTISRPETNKTFCPHILAEKNRIRQEYPMEVLDIATTVAGPTTFSQKHHLSIIFKGNQTYGQEEYFEIYRQNSLRSAQPFFDAELLELCLSVPLRIKFDEGRKRGTLRKALKEYLPEQVANRTTKAVFTDYYVQLFKDLWKDFDANTPANHPIWQIVNKNIFDENVKILLDDQSYTDGRHIVMPPVIRVINLAIWLDYLENLKK